MIVVSSCRTKDPPRFKFVRVEDRNHTDSHRSDIVLWIYVYEYPNNSRKYIINGGLRLGHVISKVVDRGLIELVGPYGFSNVLTNTGRAVATYDTGVITSYALYIILGLISFIFLLFAPENHILVVPYCRCLLSSHSSVHSASSPCHLFHSFHPSCSFYLPVHVARHWESVM
jgi:hypothetical protein